MATIRRTASFRLWQKFTSALPFGPILPSIIPADVYSTIFKSVLICNDMSRGIIPFFFLPMVAENITIPRTFIPSLVPSRVRMSTSGGGVRSRAKFWMSVPLSSWIP